MITLAQLFYKKLWDDENLEWEKRKLHIFKQKQQLTHSIFKLGNYDTIEIKNFLPKT